MGGLTKAKFKCGDKEIPVQFNPSDYTISSTPYGSNLETKEPEQEQTATLSKWGKTTDPAKRKSNLGINFRGLSQTLSFKLYFDTYMQNWNWTDAVETQRDYVDVRMKTNEILDLMIPDSNNKKKSVTFNWGSLLFEGELTNITQKFTMFAEDGKPVRAELDITMTSKTADLDKSAQVIPALKYRDEERAASLKEFKGNPRLGL